MTFKNRFHYFRSGRSWSRIWPDLGTEIRLGAGAGFGENLFLDYLTEN